MYLHARPAIDILETYLSQAISLISQQIEQTLEQTQQRASYTLSELMHEWSIPRTVIYWEYAVSNAVAFVNGLRTFIMPQFGEAEVIEYAGSSEQQEQEDDGPSRRLSVSGNSPCLKLNLGSKNIELAVYSN